MNRHARVLALLLCLAGVFSGPSAGATNIIPTKHNLSSTGPGEIKAPPGGEERICVFCHTPHNASPLTPLWNKNIQGVNYDAAAYPPYTSTTMVSKILTGPTGASRLCLSCHDGTIALGAVLLPTAPIMLENTAGGYIPSRSRIGRALTNHHPISFSYYDAASNPEINPSPPLSTLLFYSNAVIQCTTCHDPHDNGNKKFLAVNNMNSALCLLCHRMSGWETASHSASPDTWNGLSTNPWPRTGTIGPWDFGWTTVQQNGCENCHSPHGAGGAQRLLNYAAEEQNCFPCHNGNMVGPPASQKDIQAQFDNNPASRHNVAGYTGTHDPTETIPVSAQHVECVDCHNPHASNNATALAPDVSGKEAMVSGVNKNGFSLVATSQYEYEICFKCHASSSTLFPFITRVAHAVNPTDESMRFNTLNPSYHPVTGTRSIDVPSLNPPTSTVDDPEVPVNLSTMSYIYCTDCHSDAAYLNGVFMSRGPHGSPYRPILRRQYVTVMPAVESVGTYGLCYRCHNRTNGVSGILDNASFRTNAAGYGGHSGHLGSTGSPATPVQAPCSVCHDPHGVQDAFSGAGPTGWHTHLINFDTRYVTSAGGPGTSPFYTDNGGHSGSCTLVCHGVRHDGSAKYSYGVGGAVKIRW
jgi:predicted CXXCH cytochrome family protein